MTRLRQIIDDRKPDMLIADPLVELHEEEENDNTALRRIIAEFRSLAAEFNIVVIFVHHTRKGAVIPGDIDAARGASAIIGGAKIVLTLLPMSDADAELFGMPRDRRSRSRYVRLDDGRQNYAAIEDARWYQAVAYKLDNGDTVAALVPREPPDMWEEIPTFLACQIIDEIDAGMPNGQRYSNANAADERAAYPIVDGHMTERQARKAVKTWIDNQVLSERDHKDPVTKKFCVGLFANPPADPTKTSANELFNCNPMAADDASMPHRRVFLPLARQKTRRRRVMPANCPPPDMPRQERRCMGTHAPRKNRRHPVINACEPTVRVYAIFIP
jgi:hypothetical protein